MKFTGFEIFITIFQNHFQSSASSLTASVFGYTTGLPPPKVFREGWTSIL